MRYKYHFPLKVKPTSLHFRFGLDPITKVNARFCFLNEQWALFCINYKKTTCKYRISSTCLKTSTTFRLSSVYSVHCFDDRITVFNSHKLDHNDAVIVNTYCMKHAPCQWTIGIIIILRELFSKRFVCD